jgi:hypothetical protein
MVLFAGMLGLAALNRFFLVPRLIKSNEFGEQAAAVLMRLRRHILSEQALALLWQNWPKAACEQHLTVRAS